MCGYEFEWTWEGSAPELDKKILKTRCIIYIPGLVQSEQSGYNSD